MIIDLTEYQVLFLLALDGFGSFIVGYLACYAKTRTKTFDK